MSPQPPAIGVAHMIDPALYAGVELGEADFTRAVRPPALPQPAGKVADIAGFDSAVGGVNDETKPGYAMPDGGDLGLRVDGQPECRQTFDDSLLPAPQFPFAVAEQGEIVDVAEICGTA